MSHVRPAAQALLLLAILTGCAWAQTPATTCEVRLASALSWEALNPARGDRSPRAATIWGDRNGSGPTGFLVQVVDGFSSPPHIHNVTYRGVVIEGLIHNDDPEAAPMWMPAGSFWTQPQGESHITAARGETNIAYIEIESGPYLVRPLEEAFDSGERPVNVDPSNIVWLDAAASPWIAEPGPEIAFVWGAPGGLSGTLLKLPAGFRGGLRADGAHLRAVVIQGRLEHGTAGSD